MNIFSKTAQEPPIDFEQMEREIQRSIAKSPEPENYAPKENRWTPIQAIAYGITKLTWKEATAMGDAIQSKIKDGSAGSNLTAAIQAWAEEWETIR